MHTLTRTRLRRSIAREVWFMRRLSYARFTIRSLIHTRKSTLHL